MFGLFYIIWNRLMKIDVIIILMMFIIVEGSLVGHKVDHSWVVEVEESTDLEDRRVVVGGIPD
jgi:hypothetical protein